MIELIPSKRLRHFARTNLKYAKRPRRYRHLLAEAARIKPRSFVEIGVFTGLRGIETIEAASLDQSPGNIVYHGFDLFEYMDKELLKSELSKIPDPMEEKNRNITSEARICRAGASRART